MYKGFSSAKTNLAEGVMICLIRFAFILVIIGALNWGLVGLFEFDLVAWAFAAPQP